MIGPVGNLGQVTEGQADIAEGRSTRFERRCEGSKPFVPQALRKQQSVSVSFRECYRVRSSSARFHFARLAPASYVLCRNSSSAARGAGSRRASSYIRKNSFIWG